MENTLLAAGIACILGAIVGGGLKAFSIEIPLLKTWPRQFFLGVFGLVLLVIAMQMHPKPTPPTVTSPPAAQAIVQYAQIGGPFLMLGARGKPTQSGYWWNQMDISFENNCGERIYVQPTDFRLYVSSKASTDGAENFSPETIEAYTQKLAPSWVEPGAKLQGRLAFQVPETLTNGIKSNGSYLIIREFTQSTCKLVYKPY